MSVMGLILGIIGLAGALLWHPDMLVCIIWILVCIIGIIMSAMGIKMKRRKGAGIAGLILSIIGIVIAIVMTMACATLNTALNAVRDEIGTANEQEFQSALDELANALKETTPETAAPAAATTSSGSALVGVWHHGSYAYTFNADGTGDYGEGFAFTYVDNGNSVSLEYESGAKNEFGYRIDGNKLYIQDSFGNEVDYTK